MFELKPLSKDAIPAALEKAVRYRVLNEPREAESICRDILEIEPDNQDALATLLLAVTDRFAETLAAVDEAWELTARLSGEYEKRYYSGIICERRAKAIRRRPGHLGSGYEAYEWLRRAMDWYEKAEEVRPKGVDDAILRWNTCARMIMQNPDIRPEPATAPEPPPMLE